MISQATLCIKGSNRCLLYPYGAHKYTTWQNVASLKVTDKIHINVAEYRGQSMCHLTLQVSDTNILDKS